MGRCVICGDTTDRPFVAVVWHFRPLDWSQLHWVRGNFKTFGFWSGLRANITLLFPVANTLLNWKHRKSRLEIDAPDE
jgi:hypothetical protein